jgi:hypothetical protein
MQKAMDAINDKKSFKLVVVGVEANTAGEALRRRGIKSVEREIKQPKGLDFEGTSTVREFITLTVAIVVGVIAVVGLGTVASVCLYGMSLGYNIKVNHKINGFLPFDDELEFILVPPK